MLEQFLKWPKLVFSAIYEKIAAQASKTNTSFKSYLGDDKNIEYISSVVYEGIPFFLKFGLKPDSFNAKFKKHITAFRDKMYSYDDELNADKVKSEQAFEARATNPENTVEAFNSKDYPNGASPQEVHENLNAMMEQAQVVKDWEKAQEIFKKRIETPEDSMVIYDLKDYPNGISPEEVLEKIEAVVQDKLKPEEVSTRAKLLRNYHEQTEFLKERIESLNDPEQVANMASFTSDMSKEEMREKFYQMVAEARAKVNASEKKKTVRTKRVKTDSHKAAEEAHNIIMERAQSIPTNLEDMSTLTRVNGDMSREEVISKIMGISIEEARKLDKENPENVKKTTSVSKPKSTTKKVGAKTTRKKKTEE
jgi:hypothetical protein